MERVAFDVERRHFRVGDLDALHVGVGVEFAAHAQACLRRRGSDQFDHGEAAGQRLATPVLRDVAEHPVLDLVPFRRAGRIVAHGERQAGRIGELLQLDLPQTDAAAIGAAAVGGDHQPVRRGVSRAPHRFAPALDAVDGELRRVVIDADADIAGVGGDVVDAVRNRLAQFLVDEVMHVDLVGTAFGAIVGTGVFVFADIFLLFGVDRDHRLAGGLKRGGPPVDVLELRVPVGMAAAFQALAVDLAAVARLFKQSRQAAGRDPMPHRGQSRRQFGMALRHPQQGPHGIAERRGFQDGAQIRQQRRVNLGERAAPATGAANLARLKFERLKVREAAANCAARQTGRPRHASDAAMARRERLRRGEQAPATLVEAGAQKLVAKTNRNLVDHRKRIADACDRVNPAPSQSANRNVKQIQLLFGVDLVRLGSEYEPRRHQVDGHPQYASQS
jgi:hypothetical protein